MSHHQIDALEHSVQTTYRWLGELDSSLGWDERQRTYRLLRVTLHAIRDWLPVDEASHLGAQLPALIRGIYYEGWRPAATPVKPRSKGDFLATLDGAFSTDPLDDPERCAQAVFALLNEKISAGEISDVRHLLPKELQEMWPQ